MTPIILSLKYLLASKIVNLIPVIIIAGFSLSGTLGSVHCTESSRLVNGFC